MNEVGRRYETGEYWISDLMMAGMIFKQAPELFSPLPRGRRWPESHAAMGAILEPAPAVLPQLPLTSWTKARGILQHKIPPGDIPGNH